ncbi:hypothetical protein FACS189445_5030 [Spirochaetia bacterium]|nr:hypothetical protein FACS189445_5030 [Spirochaetia bacterium]
MTDNIEHESKIITNAITTNTQTVAIYLFGSYAYGQPKTKEGVPSTKFFPLIIARALFFAPKWGGILTDVQFDVIITIRGKRI